MSEIVCEHRTVMSPSSPVALCEAVGLWAPLRVCEMCRGERIEEARLQLEGAPATLVKRGPRCENEISAPCFHLGQMRERRGTPCNSPHWCEAHEREIIPGATCPRCELYEIE